jgi:hypothetical protein
MARADAEADAERRLCVDFRYTEPALTARFDLAAQKPHTNISGLINPQISKPLGSAFCIRARFKGPLKPNKLLTIQCRRCSGCTGITARQHKLAQISGSAANPKL